MDNGWAHGRLVVMLSLTMLSQIVLSLPLKLLPMLRIICWRNRLSWVDGFFWTTLLKQMVCFFSMLFVGMTAAKLVRWAFLFPIMLILFPVQAAAHFMLIQSLKPVFKLSVLQFAHLLIVIWTSAAFFTAIEIYLNFWRLIVILSFGDPLTLLLIASIFFIWRATLHW